MAQRSNQRSTESERPQTGEVFISHTHADAEVASALSDAIGEVLGNSIQTTYSTKKELEGGIKPGEEWFRWIVERVRASDIAVILLSPASVQKPWVLWEAGAVYGAGLSSSESEGRKVRPLLFKLAGSEVPSPFAGIQGSNGDDAAGISRFLQDLIVEFAPRVGNPQVVRAGQRLEQTVIKYLARVHLALRDAPLLPTEAAVEEWCARIDQLSGARRWSEVGHLDDWLRLTFGGSRSDSRQPIDLRLHRRLGEAYRAAKQPGRSAVEFDLALSFAPRDIFLLRALGLAYLDDNRLDDAAKVVKRIAELDKDAFIYNVECAALKARLQRTNGDLEGAAATYRAALEQNPNSYYLVDVLGQTLLRLGKIDDARAVYHRMSAIIDQLSEQNIWTHAARATAALVLGDEPNAIRYLEKISELDATADDLTRIEGGLEVVQKSLSLEPAELERLRRALRR